MPLLDLAGIITEFSRAITTQFSFAYTLEGVTAMSRGLHAIGSTTRDAFLAVFSGRELTFTFAICYRPSVCRLSVTLVHPTQAVELFGNFFHHTIGQGLYFSGAKNRWWGTPLSP